jgi:hypothetical protein
MALVTGRLVTDGTGRLFIMPTDDNGEVLPSIHQIDENGAPMDQLIDGIVEAKWDAEAHGYVAVEAGDSSHNEEFEKNFIEISGTTGPLFNEAGDLVFPGDPHDSEPLPTDPHYDADAPGKTKAETIPDEISATATGNTEAYT